MRTVRRIAIASLSALTTVALVGFLGGAAPTTPASASTPQWHTAAAYTPLVNVRAVSCAPSSSAASATCVAVGDDGENFASIIVTSNGGSSWSDSTVPSGVTTLSTVSCPSAAICYAGGGSGILKSSDGGSTWSAQDQTFPAQSISCDTIIECTAVGGTEIVRNDQMDATWILKLPRRVLILSIERRLPERHYVCRCRRGRR